MWVLGIDPSLTSTGLVLVEGGLVVETKRVRPKAIKNRTQVQEHERIDEILEAIDYMSVGRRAPLFKVGIEGTAYGAKGSSVVQIFGLWGVVTHQLHAWGLEYYVVPPSSRMKYATGKGQITKDEVLAAVIGRYQGLVEVTGNDIADALVVAAMGARQYDVPLEVSLPQTHLKAMDGVQW